MGRVLIGLPDRVADFLAVEPARASAVLRLPLIVLIAVLVYVGRVDHWLPGLYATVLACYTAGATVWLVVVLRRTVPWWATAASVTVDVLVLVALCLTSGGATLWLLPVFFVVPIWLVFPESPWLTAVLSLFGALGYLGSWIVYSKRDDGVGLPGHVWMQVGLLLWLAAATTALCVVLARRSARVAALLETRRRLVSESTRADERSHRELAEQLHDGPLQTLLAARLEVEEIRERFPDPALDSVYSALHETATLLRSTVTALHPQVLAELGLTAAVRELVRQFQGRGGVTVDSDVEEVGRPPSQSLVYRAARELLANVHKHAKASAVTVRLNRSGDDIVLCVTDDGIGFDPRIIDGCVAAGHIGLASLVVGVDALGGSVRFESPADEPLARRGKGPGGGTRATVTLPADAM